MAQEEMRPRRLRRIALATLIIIAGTAASAGSAIAARAVGLWMGAH